MMNWPIQLLQLKAFLGANGVVTSKIGNAEDVAYVATKLFGLRLDASEPLSLLSLQSRISSLGYAHRRAMVRLNLGTLPAHLVSTREAHKDKREGKLARRDRKYLKTLGSGEIGKSKNP
jgi:hypothetical protein